jgi:hypothetical protein
MYKKCLLFYVLFAGILSARAQVSMTLQVPPTGVLLKNQLWNMLVVNAGDHPVLIRVNLVLLDAQSSQPVLTAVSAPVSISKGGRQLQARDLGPIQYAYNIPASRVDMDPNGLLPAGSYQVCYSIVNVEKVNSTMVENCIALNVDPLSPPLLNTPADEERLLTSYPQFTWLPPTPIGLFNDLSYAMIVVEVLPGQGKADAIQQNIPVNSSAYTKNLYWNYPASYRALDTAKLYAWRIVAMNSGKPVAMSDIWTFKVANNKPKAKAVQEEPYVSVKRVQDAAMATAAEVLRISYENAAADSLVQYTISSLDDPGNPVVQQGALPLQYGQNLLKVPLRQNKQIVPNKVYLLRFTSSRNEIWSIKFTVTRK